MKQIMFALALAVLLPSSEARAQQQSNQQPIGAGVEQTAKRFHMGAETGIGLDPELVVFGVHAEIGKILRPSLTFRPGLEIGLGEITTLLNINLDVLYASPGYSRDTRWIPYFGVGPAFGLSHKGVSTEDVDDPDITEEDENRFDFGDTDFNGGLNFIFGVRKQSNVFVEMRATAWGVSNIRLVVGFNF